MEGWTLTALGFVAGTCTTFSLVPQVLKAWRSADREAISKRTYGGELITRVLMRRRTRSLACHCELAILA